MAHFYLWKRLAGDTLRPGWARRVSAVIAVLLGLLVPATLIGVRAGHVKWLAWPGYLWIALMFYLLISLIVLEIPRLVVRLTWARNGRTESIAEAPGSRSRAADGELQPAGSVPAAAGGDANAVATEAGDGTSTAASESATARDDAGGDVAGPSSGMAAQGGDAAGPGGGTAAQGGDAAGPGGGRERRLLLARGAAIFAGLTAAGVTGYGIRTATGAPRIDRVQIPIAKLPRGMDGTRLAVVSDIHLGPLTGIGHAQRITRVINSVNADVVCVVGDLVDGTVAELGRLAEPLRGIESRRGAYFVTGNHEYYSGYEPWIGEVTELGLRPLRNERVEIDGLDLAGVNDLGGEAYGDPADFGRALGDRDRNRPVVLMAHQPLAAHDAAPYGVDLQVSGHTHGGQMAPFNLLVKLQQPVVSGFGRVDGVPVYVTNGAGFWGPPVRVGAPPQVTVVELRVA
ncbi:metallophosphoesterase [Actinoplanes sp. HUAS TT8]|uniref:metallophosphoesterase n=1 Tax=Actinoplanes sp. HUAS TT8 TaxID=3447453 RepID=UPI003F521525